MDGKALPFQLELSYVRLAIGRVKFERCGRGDASTLNPPDGREFQTRVTQIRLYVANAIG